MKRNRLTIIAILILVIAFSILFIRDFFPQYIGIPLAGISSHKEFMNEESNKDTNTLFCRNKMKLLQSFDTIPDSQLDLKTVRDSIKKEIENLFEEPYCNNVQFMVRFYQDSIKYIPIALHTIQEKNCNLGEFTPHTFCFVLVNYQGKVLVEGRPLTMDNLSETITKFYFSENLIKFSRNDYNRVFISLMWDKGTSREDFNCAIHEVIEGYFNIADSISTKLFSKEICSLNIEELKRLEAVVPFNIRIDSWDEIIPKPACSDNTILQQGNGVSEEDSLFKLIISENKIIF